MTTDAPAQGLVGAPAPDAPTPDAPEHGEAGGSAASAADLALMLSWFSPAFPTGAFSYSHGLETLFEAGGLADAAAVTEAVDTALTDGAGRADAIITAHAWRAARAATSSPNARVISSPGRTTTRPRSPSTMTVSPAGMRLSASFARPTIGTSKARAMMAMWVVCEPSSRTNPRRRARS